MFQRIETDEALLSERGVYKPAEVYRGPEDGLFVKAKGGFVRLKVDGSTSSPAVRVVTLSREGPLWRDTFGRLVVEGGEKRKPVMLAGAGETLQIEDKR